MGTPLYKVTASVGEDAEVINPNGEKVVDLLTKHDPEVTTFFAFIRPGEQFNDELVIRWLPQLQGPTDGDNNQHDLCLIALPVHVPICQFNGNNADSIFIANSGGGNTIRFPKTGPIGFGINPAMVVLRWTGSAWIVLGSTGCTLELYPPPAP